MEHRTKKDWEKLFNSYDRNRDGNVSRSEVKRLMQYCGFNPTDQDIEALTRKSEDTSQDVQDKKVLQEKKGVKEKKDAKGKKQKKEDIYPEEDAVEFEEFYNFAMKQSDPFGELLDAFTVFDKNKDGSIDAKELRQILHDGEAKTDEEIESLMKEVDENGDGKLDYHEFIKVMCPPD